MRLGYGLVRFLTRLLAAAAVVGAAMSIGFHVMVITGLNSAASGMRRQPVAVMTCKAAELVVGPGGEGGADLDQCDWRQPVAATLAWWQGPPGYPLPPVLWLAIAVAVALAALWMLVPEAAERHLLWTLAVELPLAVTVAIGGFAFLNDVMVPSRSQAIIDARAQRHSFRTDFEQVTGLVGIPASEKEVTGQVEGKRFRQAVDTYLLARKDVAAIVGKGLVELGDDPEATDAIKVWHLLATDDATVIADLERQLGLVTRLQPRPGNTWAGFADPDHLPVAPAEHGYHGAAVASTETVHRRLTAVAQGEAAKPQAKGETKDDETAGRRKLLSTLLAAEIEQVQADLAIVVARRTNGPFQFAIAVVFAFGVFLFARRWCASLRQRTRVGSLPRVPRNNDSTGSRHPTGGRITRSDAEVSLARLEDRNREGRIADDLRALLALDAYRSFLAGGGKAGASAAVREAADKLQNRSAAARHTLGYLTWAIPSIGICATAFGIGNALLQAGKLLDPDGGSGEALQKFFSELSVTFDVTLFAIASSILMMWFQQRLQWSEEVTLFCAADDVQSQVVAALGDSEG